MTTVDIVTVIVVQNYLPFAFIKSIITAFNYKMIALESRIWDPADPDPSDRDTTEFINNAYDKSLPKSGTN